MTPLDSASRVSNEIRNIPSKVNIKNNKKKVKSKFTDLGDNDNFQKSLNDLLTELENKQKHILRL
jgi:hypothetical protein